MRSVYKGVRGERGLGIRRDETELLMAIAAAMNSREDEDGHEHDVVMPGFPASIPPREELVEFYLRRKWREALQRGAHNLLDLFVCPTPDPWEPICPQWRQLGRRSGFFYVPRDRKYRNARPAKPGDDLGLLEGHPATDRMIRSESSRPIGLRRTLVFYSGNGPKGVRTSWIMNEYRLPHTRPIAISRLYSSSIFPVEISLCRVYKRPRSGTTAIVPGALSSRASSSRTTHHRRPPASPHRLTSPRRPSTSPGGTHLLGRHRLRPLRRPPPPRRQLFQLPSPSHLLPLTSLPGSFASFMDKLWEWNPAPESGRDYAGFK
ncbi:unnamed protein product [Spirodela intermedia]|uniref:NAC domain-containing protein n=1 Tax=Spirodela intermedia TaxID=51605 RepID=A0ABN7EBY6_SPIIN|nr:unnamed protein product [Spirodela intermedia]